VATAIRQWLKHREQFGLARGKLVHRKSYGYAVCSKCSDCAILKCFSIRTIGKGIRSGGDLMGGLN
jgi:hypothetical protein